MKVPFLLTLAVLVLASSTLAPSVSAGPAGRRLTGHVPRTAIAQARVMGRVAPLERVSLALTLPIRDQAGLDDLLRRLYTPGNPAQDRFLTPDEFTQRFGPTEEDYEAVAAFARAHGLVVIRTAPNRALLTVSGPAAAVEAAFAVRLGRYQAADGRVFFAPSNDPVIPVSLIGRLSGIVGLDNATLRQPLSHRLGTAPHPLLRPLVPAAIKPFSRKPTFSLKPAFGSRLPNQIGSDPNTGALTPKDIKTAYNLSTTALTGHLHL